MPSSQGRKGFVEIHSSCPLQNCPVVVQGNPQAQGFVVGHCSGWQDGLTCASPCSTQLGLEYSVQMARRMQEILEPPDLLRFHQLSAASRLLVSQGIGGDFQVVLTQENRLLAIQGDVVGKGMNAGLLAAYLVGLVEGTLEECIRPARLLEKLNRLLAQRTSRRPAFATALVIEARLDEPDWILARAGHELPLLVRADGSQAELKDPDGLPLGLEAGETYREQRIPRAAGDRLFVNSDGALEAGLTPELVLSVLTQSRLHEGQLLDELLTRSPGKAPYRDDISLLLLEDRGHS